MVSKRVIHDFTWIDLFSPTEKEVNDVAAEYGLEYFTAKDLAAPTPRPKVRAYESGKFLCTVFHIPAFKHSHTSENPQEIDLIIGRHVVITARYENIDALHTFERETDVENILGKRDAHYHAFIHLMREIQNCLFDELSYIEDWIGYIEQQIFLGRQKQMVMDISQASKNILNFSRAIKPHKDIFEFLKENGTDRFGKTFEEGIAGLLKHWEHLDEMAKNNFDMLSQLRSTNDSILTTNQNEVMKFLTILAFVTFPLSLISSIFGMNTHYLPIVGQPYDFLKVMGIMAGATIIMFGYFKYKKWI